MDERKHTTKQDIEEYFDCVVAERVPLNTSYPAIVAYVREVLNRPPLCDRCDLVIDESGVGRPVGDMFDAAGLPPDSRIDHCRVPMRRSRVDVGA